MSRENVEIFRAVFAAWNAGDMDALRELYDGHVIVRLPENWPEAGPFVGIEAVMRQWQQQREAFDADALELIGDFIDVGDRLAARQTWRGAGHGPDAGLEMTHVITVRRGRSSTKNSSGITRGARNLGAVRVNNLTDLP